MPSNISLVTVVHVCLVNLYTVDKKEVFCPKTGPMLFLSMGAVTFHLVYKQVGKCVGLWLVGPSLKLGVKSHYNK